MPRRSDKQARGAARRVFEGHLLQSHDYREACRVAGVSERTGRRWRHEVMSAMQTPVSAVGTPRSPTSFEGRLAEFETLDALVRSGARLITLVGAPGIGKTRLAARWIEWSRSSQRGASTVFFDLRAIETQEAFLAEVAGRLEVELMEGPEPAIVSLVGRRAIWSRCG